jgi:hypothetical protein
MTSQDRKAALMPTFLSVGFFFLICLIEGTVTGRVLSSRNRREKKDRIGESEPFQERALSLQDKIHPGSAGLIRERKWILI